MYQPGKPRGDQTAEAFRKETDEIPVGQRRAPEDACRGKGKIAGGIAAHFRTRQPENHLGTQVIGQKTAYQKDHIENALFQHGSGSRTRQNIPDQKHHQKARR